MRWQRRRGANSRVQSGLPQQSLRLLQVEALHAALPQVRLAGAVDPQVRVVEVLRLLVAACKT